MKCTIRFILCIFTFFSFVVPALASTYYVSTNGNDSGPGTKSSPWARCPGMAGWKGSATLQAGDTVYFDSSDVWTLSTGTQGLWVKGGVTYIGDEWGGGARAKFDATKSYGQGRAIILIVEDHKTTSTIVKGFEVDGNDLESRGIFINDGDIAVSGLLNGATKRVENCEVHHTGNNQSRYMYGIIVSVNANSTVRNVELIDNIVHDADHSVIALYAGYNVSNAHIYNVTVRGNTSYGGYVDTTTSGAGLLIKNHVENVLIEENHFYDNGNGIVIERTNAPSGTSAPKNITIRNNIISKGPKGKGVGIYTHGATSSTVNIYGNLIVGNPKGGIKFESNLRGTPAWKIYNNTFYNNSLVVSGGSFSTLEVKNNIFYPSGISDPGGRIRSRSNNITSNPSFKNTSNLPTGFTGTHGVDLAPNKDGLSVISGKALGGGANLGASYNMSINSVTRPSSGRWDVGAYQYTESDLKLSPPSGFRILTVF